MKQETLTILKNFGSINKCIRINEGNELIIFNPTIPLFAHAIVDDNFKKTFSIYDLNQWLSTLSLFNEPHIAFEDKQMVISSGRMSAKYRYSAPSITADQPSAPPSIPAELFSFDLKKEQLSEILKASSVLGLKELEFSLNGIRTFTSDANGNAVDNEYTTAIEGLDTTSDDHESVKIKIDSLKMMPLNYRVSVTNKVVVFKSEDGKVTYYTGIVKKS